MKYSQFNSIISYNENYVLYNTFANKAIVLEPFLKDLLEAAINEGIDSLEEFHPSFYLALKNNDFIIDTSINEVEKVKKLRDQVDFNEEIYHLTINPTMNCNFKCWYCYETHIKKSRMNEDIIKRVNKFLSTQILTNTNLKYFNLSWFGGEPLLYFYDIVLPIIKHFNLITKESGIDGGTNFTSNGFLINKKMVELFKLYNVHALQITLDGYGKDHDSVRFVSEKRGSYEKIIENVILLLQNEIYVRLRINYTYINIVNCHKIIEDIINLTEKDRQYLLIDFHRVWQDKEPCDENFIFSQINEFRKAGFTVSSNLSMNSVRDSCYADKKNSAVINYNGDVFKCTARDFTKNNRAGYIDEDGYIIWENNSLERRMNAKFKNKPCLSCRLLPICNGGCSQHAVEYLDKGDYCIFDFDEAKKDEVIRQKVNDLFELV